MSAKYGYLVGADNLAMASTFSGSGATPLPDTMWPKNLKELHRKSHLVHLACSFLSHTNVAGQYGRYVPNASGMDLLKTKMSSSIHISQSQDRPLSASCMNLWKVLGTLVNPNGMILNSNNPYLHANAARCWCSGAMHIWWYPHYKSRLLKTQCPFRWSSNSSMHGKGYLSNLVLAFSNLKSTHSHKLHHPFCGQIIQGTL